MEEESFNDVMGHAPVYSSGLPGVSVTNPAEFKEWHGRVRRAHEREVREHTLEYDIDGLSDRELAEHGLVRMAVDADGVPIRVGDTLDGYGKTIEVVEMRYGRGGWVLISRDGNGYADTFAFTHHHEPTVEDVLREFAYGLGVPVADSYVAASAAKLRLAEGEDE